jgi:hypothetical protein
MDHMPPHYDFPCSLRDVLAYFDRHDGHASQGHSAFLGVCTDFLRSTSVQERVSVVPETYSTSFYTSSPKMQSVPSHHGSSLSTDVTENILSTFSCRVHTIITDDENDCCVLREKVESERLSHHMK